MRGVLDPGIRLRPTDPSAEAPALGIWTAWAEVDDGVIDVSVKTSVGALHNVVAELVGDDIERCADLEGHTSAGGVETRCTDLHTREWDGVWLEELENYLDETIESAPTHWRGGGWRRFGCWRGLYRLTD